VLRIGQGAAEVFVSLFGVPLPVGQ
jgi:hypothetical protein